MSDTASIIAPLLLSADECATLAGTSRTTWFGWQAAGLIPAAVLRHGRVVRWSRADIESWVSLGCPSKEVFELHRGPRR